MVRRDGCDALGVKVGEHKEIIEAGRAADIYRSERPIAGASETTLENAGRWRVGDAQNVLAWRGHAHGSTATPSPKGNNTKRELGEATAHDYDSSASSRGRFSTGHFPVEDTSAKSWRPNFFLHATNLLLESTPPFTWKEMALAHAYNSSCV